MKSRKLFRWVGIFTMLSCVLFVPTTRGHEEERREIEYFRTFYVDQSHKNASDDNPGTEDEPFRSVQRGVDQLKKGDLLYIKEGVYTANFPQHAVSVMEVSRSGTRSRPITIKAFPGHTVILDAEGEHFRAGFVHADYVRIAGLSFVNARRWGLTIEDAKNVTVSRCEAHDNATDGHGVDGGFQIQGDSEDCTIRYCESYRNGTGFTIGVRDAENNPKRCIVEYCVAYRNAADDEDSDGFSFIQTSECTLRYCMAYQNADDGINTQGPDCDDTLIEYCLSFRNDPQDTEDGDGNGFKLSAGGSSKGGVVRRCVAFLNSSRGFDDGNSIGSVYVHNVAVSNGRWGFFFEGTDAIAYNNIAVRNYPTNPSEGAARDAKTAGPGRGTTTSDYNLWADGRFIEGEDEHSLSGDAGFLRGFEGTGPFQVDVVGYVPDVPGLHLGQRSIAIDAGLNLGWPFYGEAPDLGPYETVTFPD